VIRVRSADQPTLRDPAASGRVFFVGLFLLAIWQMARLTEFDLLTLFAAFTDPAPRNFLLGFFPPAHSVAFLTLALVETWRTVAIATCGMFIAGLIGLPIAILLTRVLSLSAIGQPQFGGAVFSGFLRRVLRSLMVFLRSVPELIWALLLVRVVGLGPTAGVLAIAISYSGMLGKVYAEIFESVDPLPTLSLLNQGASRLQAFAFGLLPQCSDELISYSVYRWECAVRSSVILGFVGAGGLGQQMDLSMKMFAGDEVCTLLILFVLLVSFADWASQALRKAWE